MKIKSMLAVVLAIATLFAMSTVAFAAELNQDTTTGNAIAVYKAGQVTDPGDPDDPTDDVVGGTYTVTIPDYIEVAGIGTTPTEYDVAAKDVLIPVDTDLTVAVGFDVLAQGANTLTYDMKANPQSAGTLQTIASGDTVLTVAAGDPDAVTTSKVAAVLTQAPSYSGTYLDTATFTVAVA